MKTPHISKRIWMAISTAAVIAILFVYYLMIYIPNRERELNSKKFRTLQQAGENFFNRKKAYEISIEQALDEYNKKFYDCDPKSYFDFAIYEKCKKRADSVLEKRLKPIRPDVYTPLMGMQESDSLLNLRISRAGDLIFPGTRFKKRNYNFISSADAGYQSYYTSQAKYYNFSVGISQLVTSSAGMINNHFNKFMLIRVFDVRNKKAEPTSGSQALIISSSYLAPSADDKDKSKEKGEKEKDSVIAVIAFQGMGNLERPGSENKIILADLKKLFQGEGLSSIPVQTVNVSGIPHKLFAHVIQNQADEDWVLCGLIEESTFNRDVKRVSLLMIVFLFLSLFFVLLAMPILKLLIMSAIERLQIINVWFTGFCIVIGTTVIFLILLTSSQFVGYERVYNENLQKVSDTILNNFNDEIISVVQQMRRSDVIRSAILDQKQSKLDFIQAGHLLRPQKDFFEKNLGKVLDTATMLTADYPFFNETMWTNDKGNQVIRLANHGVNERVTALNIAHRNYFKNALNEKLYPLYSRNGEQIDTFCLESIYSWYNLTNEAGISVRMKEHAPHNLKVLSMATKLHSVMDVLLPPGYEYCIISPDGRVLFHHDKNKNLQENFFLEIDHERLVRAAVAGRHALCKSITYNGKNYQANITPITHQELFLVTLFDRDYYKTPVVLTFGFSFVLVLILFFLQGIQVVLLFFTTYKFTKLRINRFFLSWLRPRVDSHKRGKKENPQTNPNIVSFREIYIRVIAAMVFITALLILVIAWNTDRHLILPFITLPIILLTFHYAIFNGNVCRLAPGKLLRKRFVIVSMILLVIVNLASFQYFSSAANLMLVILQGLILLIYAFFLYAPFPKTFFSIPVSYHTLYITFLSFWLVLVSVLPVCYFYKVSFDREMKVWTRYVQWKAFQDNQKRIAQVDIDLEKLDFFDNRSPDYSDQRKRYIAHMNRFGNYLHADGTFVCLKDSATNNFTAFDSLSIDPLEFDLRPVYFGPMEDSRLGLTTRARDLWWRWENSSDTVLINVDTKLGDFKYASPILPYRIFSGQYGPFLFILLLLVLYLICRVIIIVVRKIFGMHLIETCQPSPVTFEKLKEMAEHEAGNRHRLFLVGLPFSGKSNLLQAVKDHWKDKAEVISLRTDFSHANLEGKKVIIILHFEHGINDHATNIHKAELIQKLLATHDTTIIVSSAIQPSIIIDVYERKIERISAEKKTDENRLEIQKELTDLRSAFRIWKNLLSDFEILYHPLKHDGRRRAIDGELNYGTYLPKLAVHFKNKLRKRLTEDTILEIEEKAELYYHSLWNCFTKDEKHLLYDLAKDRFVNTGNMKMLRILIQKGVIVVDDTLRIMNKSFNNFILAAVKEDEEIAMTNELRRKGSWYGVHFILVILLVGIAVFIGLAQQEWLSHFNALIASVGGILTVLLRFGGFFTSKSRDAA